tara:strand:+ start:20618 stop:23041 length:2424 start_codon:yes stop_codon:yes gene_type:complete
MSRPRGNGRVITIDTENIGLIPVLREGDSTSSHCIVCKDKETEEYFVFFDKFKKREKKTRVWLDEWEGRQDGSLSEGVKFLNESDVIISQNWLGYDELALKKVHGDKLKVNFKAPPRGGKKRRNEYPFRVMDTMVMSQLLHPDRRPPPQAYAMERGNVSPHSIEAHGIRIGRYKPENNDWTRLTDHMILRCWEDVAIGASFFDYLMEEWEEQSATHPKTGLSIIDAYRMEAVMYNQMALKAQRGFRLDINYAFKLVKTLDKEIERILEHALPHLPLRIKMKKLDHVAMKTAANKRGHKYRVRCEHGSSRSTNWGFTNLNGNYSNPSKKDYPDYAVGNINDHKSPTLVGAYTPVVWEIVSLGNRDVVRQTLYKLGWRGVNLTDGEEKYLEENGKLPYKFAGKLNSESIARWEKRKKHKPPQWAKDILAYYVLTHRRSQVFNKKDFDYFVENGEFPKESGKTRCRGLVPKARCQASDLTFQELIEMYGAKFWTKKGWDKDGEYRVPSEAFSIGTNTFRMRHKVVVNIPSRGLFGKEMRRLFIAGKGFKVMGADAAGIQMRMLAHFMNDKKYMQVILSGDIHKHNQELGGMDRRDLAKTFIYAFLFGSGVKALAMLCGVTQKVMSAIISRFLAELPELDSLIENVKAIARERGYFVAVDGRWGRVRKTGRKVKEHTALNVLLQMTDSLCVKWAMYFAFEEMERQGLPNRLLTIQHDEGQWEVPDDSPTFTYNIHKDDWKAEEGKVMKKEGVICSAPTIIKEKGDKLTIKRCYDPYGDIVVKAFAKAGKYLKIRTPLTGEYKVGDSWLDTH